MRDECVINDEDSRGTIRRILQVFVFSYEVDFSISKTSKISMLEKKYVEKA